MGRSGARTENLSASSRRAWTTPPATRLVLNGTAVTEADYEAALADVIAGDLDATVEIVDNGITPEHRLTTTEA